MPCPAVRDAAGASRPARPTARQEHSTRSSAYGPVRYGRRNSSCLADQPGQLRPFDRCAMALHRHTPKSPLDVERPSATRRMIFNGSEPIPLVSGHENRCEDRPSGTLGVDAARVWRAAVINGALAGEVPGTEFEVNQAFLSLTTIYILIPSLMVVVSLPGTAGREQRSTLWSASSTSPRGRGKHRRRMDLLPPGKRRGRYASLRHRTCCVDVAPNIRRAQSHQ